MTTTAQDRPRNPMLRVLAQRDFRLLWIGQGTSLLGDQFALIAMPWLVLQLTGDPLALGGVLAVAGVPRLVSMLLGGAVVDRFSPRKIMLASDACRIFLFGLLAALTAAGAVQLWMLYAISFLSGTVSGFFIPASNAVVPRLVERENLQAGNSVFQGTTSLAQAVGPALAGGIIAWFAHLQSPSAAPSLDGIAAAFAFDTLTFIISVVTLWMMSPQPDRPGAQGESVTGAVAAGIRYLGNDPFLRLLVMIMALANFVVTGPLNVGVPLLAKTRLAEGAAAYGIIMSAYALGNLAGILGAGSFVRPSGRLIRTLTLGMFTGFALCLAAFGWVHATWIIALMMVVLGVGNGYNVISLFTLLQKRTPENMMGRLMGMVMIANIGLIPVSQSLAGLLSRWSLTGLFEITGIMMLVLAVWLAVQKEFSAEKLASQLQSTPIFPPRGGVEP